jgi:hypothetical protein
VLPGRLTAAIFTRNKQAQMLFRMHITKSLPEAMPDLNRVYVKNHPASPVILPDWLFAGKLGFPCSTD